MINYKKCFGILSTSLLISCANNEVNNTNKTVHDIYTDAYKKVQELEFLEAAKTFRDIDNYHPYSSWAKKSQIMSAFCYFRAEDYKSAVREIDIFLKYNPHHELAEYANYLRAMCHFVQIQEVGKNIEPALVARKHFSDIIKSFENSKYAIDAKHKISLINDLLAANEMYVAKFYQRKKNSVAAIKRLEQILVHFPDTKHAQEANFRVIEILLEMGELSVAKTWFLKMQEKFKTSLWTQNAKQLLKSINVTEKPSVKQ